MIIVGAGPTGLVAANLLARSGHSIALIKRHAQPYGLPRAGYLDHETFRTLQAIDCLDSVMADADTGYPMVWCGCGGDVLFEVPGAPETTSSFPTAGVYQG